jgi:hypothetical protein
MVRILFIGDPSKISNHLGFYTTKDYENNVNSLEIISQALSILHMPFVISLKASGGDGF